MLLIDNQYGLLRKLIYWYSNIIKYINKPAIYVGCGVFSLGFLGKKIYLKKKDEKKIIKKGTL